ncbi:MFS transporter [uncultured Microbacterium sp.]|uniref:MFS transporter n=1 Tax=uncultured Microbacterium sp. TaxID=191216 RepID=UPI0025E72138|nr:MFS transporter [uncultured Microbacterium sp.]
MLGNIVEYYDFTLYGTLAAIIAVNFFPAEDKFVALLGVYVGIVLSYAIRPIGSLILGPIGDIKGRKFVLILTIALMTIGTAGIGVLPTYAAIGVAAPILLMASRLLQGIGASVEYTTASNFLLEHERGNRRNLISGILNSTASIGSLGAALVAYVLSALMPTEAFTAWGWRIPFLIALPIAAIGVYMRRHLNESAEFQEVLREAEEEKVKPAPVRETFKRHWRDILRVLGLSVGQRIGSYIIQAYFVTALITAGFPATQALLASVLTYLVGPITSVWGGWLADRFGGRIPLIVGYGLFVVLTVPTFYLIGQPSIALATIAVVVFTLINNLVAAPLTTAFSLSFPAEVRATAASLSFNIATSLFGATAGLVAVWLAGVTGSNVAFGWYVTIACVVSLLVTIFALPECLKYKLEAKKS